MMKTKLSDSIKEKKTTTNQPATLLLITPFHFFFFCFSVSDECMNVTPLFLYEYLIDKTKLHNNWIHITIDPILMASFFFFFGFVTMFNMANNNLYFN